MTTLKITRGIPASGKSTFAKKWVDEKPAERARVNRDDIRFQLYGKYWGVDEGAVTLVQNAQLRALLKKRDVVLDNTNLKSRDVKDVLKLAAEVGAEVEFEDFPIPLGEALSNDAGRERKVGEAVIRSFYDRYTPGGKFPPVPVLDSELSMEFEPYKFTPGLPDCIIVDIDGTLAHMDDRRSPYDPSKYHLDRFDKVVANISQSWRTSGWGDRGLILLSGRDDTYRSATTEWLNKHGFFYDALYMRPAGDTRNDAIVKNELFEKHVAGKYNVDFVLDDRTRVVKMWRAKGLKCLQVADGDF